MSRHHKHNKNVYLVLVNTAEGLEEHQFETYEEMKAGVSGLIFLTGIRPCDIRIIDGEFLEIKTSIDIDEYKCECEHHH